MKIKAQQDMQRIVLADSDSIQLKLKEMGVELVPKKLEQYMEKQERLKQLLQQIKFQVNNN